MEKSRQRLALGDEAVAMAAIDSGVSGFYGYPGTPSTEVFEAGEHLIKKLDDGRVAQWGPNEKVGYEMALGCSYSGRRSIATMKHVGLNVAMDAFVNSAVTGVQGGLVVLVADDPSMHSSQNEQDSRVLAEFALVPCLEPSNPQEVYDMTCEAFEMSERLKLPVMLRLTTRTAHSRGLVGRKETLAPTNLGIPQGDDKKKWVLIPANARVQYRRIRDEYAVQYAEAAKFNTTENKPKRVGVVTAGMGKAYYDQLLKDEPTVAENSRLDIMAYPINEEVVLDFLANNDEIIVFEENYPYIEDMFKARAKGQTIRGRRDETMPIDGELNPMKLRKALGLTIPKTKAPAKMDLTVRPPKLCDGCGHIDAFQALNEAYKQCGLDDQRVFGDIGCYTLGFLPPFNGIHTTVEMGASFGMAYGAATAGMSPSVGVIGDSTFFHSGLSTMVAAAESQVNVNFVIMDNRITGMTGQQETVVMEKIQALAKAGGFKDEDVITLIPLKKNHEENVAKLVETLKKDSPSVIVFQRDCIQAMRKGLYKKIEAEKKERGL